MQTRPPITSRTSPPPHLPPARSAPALRSPSGAEWVVRFLRERGIGTVAGIPGGAILPLYDALHESGIRHVLCRHEQGAAFVAQGMARATGRVGVCLATSGPGATNLVTALADALADSVPLLAITAQVSRALIGTNAFQEVDTCAIASPVTKACFFVDDAQHLPSVMEEALRIAEEGRKGPVLVDVPKDVWTSPTGVLARPPGAATSRPPRRDDASTARAAVDAPMALPEPAGRVLRHLDARDEATWVEIATLLAESERPLLFVGAGVQWARASEPLRRLVERAGAQVVCTLHGLGAFPARHPAMLGMLGMHGHEAANRATEEADLVLAIGVRFDDRATGDPTKFCRSARIVHVDVDPRELGKIKPVDVGVVADARVALERLCAQVRPRRQAAWSARARALAAASTRPPRGDAVAFLERLARHLHDETVVTTDVGQHQMWVAQHLPFSRPRSLLTSGGLGTMGFGLPAAIGAALALPGHTVACVTGDGSLWMNLQELATLRELGLDVCVIVLNNAQLGMVRQQQSLFYGGRHLSSRFGASTDFASLARSLGIEADGGPAAEFCDRRIGRALCGSGPRLLDVRLRDDDDVLPMVPPGGDNLNMILR